MRPSPRSSAYPADNRALLRPSDRLFASVAGPNFARPDAFEYGPITKLAGNRIRATVTASAEGEYDIRPYGPNDRDGFLSLYERVWGRTKGPEWFEWRFERNPYATDVEMIVAERDGDLVGAEPLLPFPLRIGDRDLFAYQPVDWIVDPDHRRRGLFTRMTERLIDRYSARADLLFNFPSEMLLPGLRKFDWRVVGPVPQAYRVQNLDVLVTHKANANGVPGTTIAAAMCEPLLDGWLRVRDRFGGGIDDVAVDRHESVPVADLTALAAAGRPDRIHVPRDREFYEWRFANPRWETTTYLARRDGEPVAAVVAATERCDERAYTQLLDVQPMRKGAERPDAVAALLGELVGDNRDVDLLKACPSAGGRVTRKRGFLRDDALPLSAVATQTTHVVRPLAADGDLRWHVDGRDLTDPDAWRLALADLDVE